MNTALKTATVYKWRVLDIVMAAILGVACGVALWGINVLNSGVYEAMGIAVPGSQGLLAGGWLLGGLIGGLVIRKPGAAIIVETIAGIVALGIGNEWGLRIALVSFVHGLGVEIVFAILRYRKWNLWVAMAAGASGGIISWFGELFIFGHLKWTFQANATYLVCFAISGAAVGAICWYLVKGLASTGVLDRFASGREVTREI